jgi:1-acyl-sn-glycerol-3-phosphate acyltransferase
MIGAVFRKREMMFLGRKTLFKAGFWNTLLSHINVIPVDKENIVNIRALKRAFAALRDGLGLVIFPEGTRSLDGYFGTAQPGIGFLACKTQVPVIPVRIFGTYEILKKNCIIPNLYLSAQIVIGKALLPEQYDHFRGEKDRYNRTADYIFEAIKHLTLP